MSLRDLEVATLRPPGYSSIEMPGRLTSERCAQATYSAPVLEDYGDLFEITASQHIAAFQGIQGAVGLLTFSGNTPPGSGNGGFAGGGVDTTPAGSVQDFAGGNGPSGGGSPSGGGGPSGGVAASSGGKLPFTGFALAAEGIAGLASVSIGLAFRRFTRRRGDAPAGDSSHG